MFLQIGIKKERTNSVKIWLRRNFKMQHNAATELEDKSARVTRMRASPWYRRITRVRSKWTCLWEESGESYDFVNLFPILDADDKWLFPALTETTAGFIRSSVKSHGIWKVMEFHFVVQIFCSKLGNIFPVIGQKYSPKSLDVLVMENSNWLWKSHGKIIEFYCPVSACVNPAIGTLSS